VSIYDGNTGSADAYDDYCDSMRDGPELDEHEFTCPTCKGEGGDRESICVDCKGAGRVWCDDEEGHMCGQEDEPRTLTVPYAAAAKVAR